jgi:hypothetical protein
MSAQVMHRACAGATCARVQGVPYRDTERERALTRALGTHCVRTSLHTSLNGASS